MRFPLFSKFLCHLLCCIGRFRKNANSLHFIFFPSSGQPSHTETFMRTYFTEIGYHINITFLSLSLSLNYEWQQWLTIFKLRLEITVVFRTFCHWNYTRIAKVVSCPGWEWNPRPFYFRIYFGLKYFWEILIM